MTKKEFIGKVKDMLAMNAVYPDIKADLDSVIHQAIAEHEASHNKSRKEIIDYFKSQYGDPEQYTDAKAVIEGINYCFDFGIAEHEQSKWKKYPENKPERRKAYLVQYKGGGYKYRRYLIDGLWPYVIAFRELPKPYQEERQSFGNPNGCHNCKHQDNDDVCKKCDDTWDKWEGGEK